MSEATVIDYGLREVGDGVGDGAVDRVEPIREILDWQMAIECRCQVSALAKSLPSQQELPQLISYTWRIVEDFFINKGEPDAALKALFVLRKCLAATGQQPCLSLRVAGYILVTLKGGILLPVGWESVITRDLNFDKEGPYLGENELAFETALSKYASTIFQIKDLREYLSQARNQNNWKAAVLFQRMILVFTPTSGHEWFVLSHLHERAGDLASALATVREVRDLPAPIDMEHELDPHLIEAWDWLRERIRRRIEELEGAQDRPIPAKSGEAVSEWTDHYLRLSKEDLTYCPTNQLRLYARQAEDQGNWEKVVVFRRELRKKDPGSTEEMRLLASALVKLGSEWNAEALALIETVAARQIVTQHPKYQDTVRFRDMLRIRVWKKRQEQERAVRFY